MPSGVVLADPEEGPSDVGVPERAAFGEQERQHDEPFTPRLDLGGEREDVGVVDGRPA